MSVRFVLVFCLIVCGAASAAAQERQWLLDASEQDAFLMFGVPDTDDVGVSLWCRLASGEINIFLPDGGGGQKSGKTVTLTVIAGDQVAEFEAKTQPSEETGMTSVEAKAPSDHPLFTAMIDADRFKTKIGDDVNVFPLIDSNIDDLLKLCKPQ